MSVTIEDLKNYYGDARVNQAVSVLSRTADTESSVFDRYYPVAVAHAESIMGKGIVDFDEADTLMSHTLCCLIMYFMTMGMGQGSAEGFKYMMEAKKGAEDTLVKLATGRRLSSAAPVADSIPGVYAEE